MTQRAMSKASIGFWLYEWITDTTRARRATKPVALS
jgi:hypothetical protein